MKILVALSSNIVFVSTSKPLSGKISRPKDRSKRAVRGNESAWWKNMTRQSQHKYLNQHRKSTKKSLNLKDGNNSDMLPGSGGNKNKSGKKEEKKYFTSEELLKKAGISTNEEGLQSANPLNKIPDIDPKSKPAVEQRVNSVDERLPPVDPEHLGWKGFRQLATKHINTVGKSATKRAGNRVGIHRSYNGILDFMGGKQPNKAKRQAAETMVAGIIDDLAVTVPHHPAITALCDYKKEAASMYFGSLKARYAGRTSPFRESTHKKLARFHPTSKSHEEMSASSSLLQTSKSEEDEFDHVSSFVTSDFIDWVSSNNPSKMEKLLSSKKNKLVSVHSLKKPRRG